MKTTRGLLIHARLAVAAAAVCLPATAWPHAFNRRYDLPAPLSYFVGGAAAAVGLSLVVAALFARTAPPASRPAGAIVGSLPGLPALQLISRIVGLALFALVVVAGLFGEGDPLTNIAPTLVWIIWWVGLSLVVACVGNIWPALDPWRSLFDLMDSLTRRWRNNDRITPYWTYPQALGKWPAVMLLLAIAWFELVYTQAAIPFNIACVALAWSLVTLLGMVCFGRESWQRNADVFAVYFDVIGRFAPLAARPGSRSIELRPPGRGLITEDASSTAMTAFIIAMLSTVLFDGLFSGQLWRLIMRTIAQAAPQLIDDNGYLLPTAGLIGLWLIFLAAFVLSCWVTARLVRDYPLQAISGLFVVTLVPIAVAYNVAHNFSMLVVQGQELIPLMSDPLGHGWNLFGSAKFTPAIGSVDARTTWYVAIGAIVAGHVISIWLAHRVALREFGTPRRAVIASTPLTVLMMVYTAISLSIIAEPMVKFNSTGQTEDVLTKMNITR